MTDQRNSPSGEEDTGIQATLNRAARLNASFENEDKVAEHQAQRHTIEPRLIMGGQPSPTTQYTIIEPPRQDDLIPLSTPADSLPAAPTAPQEGEAAALPSNVPSLKATQDDTGNFQGPFTVFSSQPGSSDELTATPQFTAAPRKPGDHTPVRPISGSGFAALATMPDWRLNSPANAHLLFLLGLVPGYIGPATMSTKDIAKKWGSDHTLYTKRYRVAMNTAYGEGCYDAYQRTSSNPGLPHERLMIAITAVKGNSSVSDNMPPAGAPYLTQVSGSATTNPGQASVNPNLQPSLAPNPARKANKGGQTSEMARIRGTTARGTASRGASSQDTASRGTTGRGTTARGTTSRGTTSRGTTPRGTTPRGTTSRGTTPRGTTTRGATIRSFSSNQLKKAPKAQVVDEEDSDGAPDTDEQDPNFEDEDSDDEISTAEAEWVDSDDDEEGEAPTEQTAEASRADQEYEWQQRHPLFGTPHPTDRRTPVQYLTPDETQRDYLMALERHRADVRVLVPNFYHADGSPWKAFAD